jgi:hypothetical protein
LFYLKEKNKQLIFSFFPDKEDGKEEQTPDYTDF